MKLFPIWLFFHKIKCSFWNRRLMKIERRGKLISTFHNEYISWWLERDKFRRWKKRMPLSLKYFRLYVYLRKVQRKIK